MPNRIKLNDVTRFIALQKIQKEIGEELTSLEERLLKVIPANGFRLVGMHQVCHKTGRRRTVSWKNEVYSRLGNAVGNDIMMNAPFGKLSHSIKVEMRHDLEDIRKNYTVPDHIPDVQIADYIITKTDSRRKEE